MKLPQLSLRDLFWLVALSAMGCGWWVDRQRLADDHERDAFTIEYLEGILSTRYGWRFEGGIVYPPQREHRNEWKRAEFGIIDEPSR